MGDQTYREGADPVEIVSSESNQSLRISQFGLVGTEPLEYIGNINRNTFMLSAVTQISSSGEIPVLLLTNPAGSGKVLHLFNLGSFIESTINSLSVLKFFTQSTIINNGTSIPIYSTVLEYPQQGSAMLGYTLPTVTNLGNRFWGLLIQGGTAGGGNQTINFNGGLSMTPGTSVLITFDSDGTNRILNLSLMWLERSI